jgi:uncharacterized protein YndB with AHSA1/START domain
MRTCIVSYADASFRLAQQTLNQSARRFGIQECRGWDRKALEQTILYKMHQPVLDMRRGAGYWLWKPFIIKEALKEMEAGDLVLYSDAGIEIVADVSPLLELCRTKGGLLLFAGHYDDVGAPGPNLCGKWTKRDCFVFMDCDEPRYHEGQMLDASFMIFAKNPRAEALVREWLLCCSQRQLLADEPNVCGLPNLPGFIQHRHDQSILSLLALREGLELFRHPSQHGNHLKDEPYRQQGEWTRSPYGAKGIYRNSPYGTLLRHHRGSLGLKDLGLDVRRTMAATPEAVFRAWTQPESWKKWSHPAYGTLGAELDVRTGGRYQLLLTEIATGRAVPMTGVYAEVDPPRRLVYSWPLKTRVTVEFQERSAGTEVILRHEAFTSERAREDHVVAWSAFLERLAADFRG